MYTIPRIELAMIREGSIKVAHRSIAHADHASDVAYAMIGKSPVEKMIAIMLDASGVVTNVATIAQGGMSQCQVSIPALLRAVLTSHAAGFILAHNHPSGDPTPSREDVTTTRIIKEACAIVGVPMLDHIVVTSTIGKWSSVIDNI